MFFGTVRVKQPAVSTFEAILNFALESKRPHRSEAIQDLCDQLTAIVPGQSRQDPFGNVWVDLRAGEARTCFMAHLDTVHPDAGPNPVQWGGELVSTGNNQSRHLVPEIVNISVGYEACHTRHETLTLAYLMILFGKCLAMDWETLGVHRQPADAPVPGGGE